MYYIIDHLLVCNIYGIHYSTYKQIVIVIKKNSNIISNSLN